MSQAKRCKVSQATLGSLDTQRSNLVQNLEPDVFSPMRRNGRDHQSLEFNIAQDHVTVHSDTSRNCGLTVDVTSVGQVKESRFQGELEIGTEMGLAVGGVTCRIIRNSLFVVLDGLTN